MSGMGTRLYRVLHVCTAAEACALPDTYASVLMLHACVFIQKHSFSHASLTGYASHA